VRATKYASSSPARPMTHGIASRSDRRGRPAGRGQRRRGASDRDRGGSRGVAGACEEDVPIEWRVWQRDDKGREAASAASVRRGEVGAKARPSRHTASHTRASFRSTVEGMRAVDLALFADLLAARVSALAAKLEQARAAVRQAAIEREARRALSESTVARLESIGVFERADSRGWREDIARLAAELAAVEELQAWVEKRLFHARAELEVDGDARASPLYRGARATRSPPSSS
jgi:hypothetical protein